MDRFTQYLRLAELVPNPVVAPRWMSDGSSFWYADGPPGNARLLRCDPATATVEPLLDVAAVRKALAVELGYEPAGEGLPFSEVTLSDADRTTRYFRWTDAASATTAKRAPSPL